MIEVVMVVRIEQLEHRLATMASLQHRSHSRGEASTSYGGDDLFYMASVAQIEVSVARFTPFLGTLEVILGIYLFGCNNMSTFV
jgi:hypothetical protein